MSKIQFLLWTMRMGIKNIKLRIITEEYMEDETAEKLGSLGLTDYKIFCFNVKKEFVYVSCSLENHKTPQISF